MKLAAAVVLLTLAATAAHAEPRVYEIDPMHTFPSFEADHMGISNWRGKFNKSHGTITLDKAANTGSVDVTIDIASVDYGLDEMNEQAKTDDLFGAAAFPQAKYTGTLAGFTDGKPTRVDGTLTLHGVTRPVVLEIVKFGCIPHPMYKRDYCGADARATLDREDFGITAGKDYGFDMKVELRIQVEAIVKE